MSNREMMALGLDLRAVVVSDIAGDPYLRNETKSRLREVCVDHGTVARHFNQTKVKIKEVNILAKIPSMDERHDDLGWSEDESGDEVVGSAPETNTEETENKIKSSLEKEIKQSLKNWRDLDRGMK